MQNAKRIARLTPNPGKIEQPCTMLVLLSTLVAALILTFDLSLPLGVAGSVPYAALVLLGMWMPTTRAAEFWV